MINKIYYYFQSKWYRFSNYMLGPGYDWDSWGKIFNLERRPNEPLPDYKNRVLDRMRNPLCLMKHKNN